VSIVHAVAVTASLARDVTLPDGAVAHIRPVRPADRGALEQLHDVGLGDASAYYRFFGIRPHLSASFLDHLTMYEPASRATLVAVVDDEIVAAGSYNRVRVDAVEVAFAVTDRCQGQGIGTVLLEDLAVLARSEGFSQLVAHTLAGNKPMLDVFAHVGLQIRHHLDDGIVDVEMDLHDDVGLAQKADEREWAAQAVSMQPYLTPKSVVIIGAGRNPSSVGHRIAVNAQRNFTGTLAVIRPDGESIAGITAFRSVGEVPFAIDLAVIAVPASVAPQVIEECGQAGVRACVVITAGFSETGDGARVTDGDLVRIAHRSGMRLLGPNCFGVVASAVGLDTTFSIVPVTPGGIAFGSQSGGLGIAVIAEANERGIGLSSFVSLGNRADVSSNDLLCAWADDPNTRVIMLYLESIGNPRRFLRIARHVARHKPIVMLKAGRSNAGRRGAASHTASLASDDAATEALLAAAGVIRVDTLEELLDVAQVLDRQPAPSGPRVALVGNAGGPLILGADAAERAGLQVPTLSEGLRNRILARVPSAAATSNPVDLLATVDPAAVGDVVALVAASGEIDAVVVANVGLRPSDDSMLHAALDAGRPGGPAAVPTPVPVVVSVAGIPLSAREQAVFRYSEHAVRAIGHAYRWRHWAAAHEAEHGADLADVDWLAVRRLVRAEARAARNASTSTSGDASGGTRAQADPDVADPDVAGLAWLAPEAVERVLRAAGVHMVRSGVADGEDDVDRIAAELLGGAGGRLVLKAIVPGLVHKTEAGAVVLDVTSAAGAVAVYRSFVERFPGLTGVLLQQRALDGAELLVGARQDAGSGPLVVVAAGGVEAEMLGDRVIRTAPLSSDAARDALLSLRTAGRLTGFRGSPALDVMSAADVVCRIAKLAAVVPELVEFEVNPLVVSVSGSLGADARVRVRLDDAEVHPLRGG
jgi:succinyl-CoA synthetase alpha subunit/GNAT superfamily N-acetyltransferase